MIFEAALDLTALGSEDGFAINGLRRNSSLGDSVSDAGDVNGDGIDDIIIGTNPTIREDGLLEVGYIVYGRGSDSAPANSPEATFELSELNGSNGLVLTATSDVTTLETTTVSSAGDVNGDGFSDVIVGAPAANGAGKSYVVFGRSTGDPTTARATVSLSALETGSEIGPEEGSETDPEVDPENSNGFVITSQQNSDGFGKVVSSAGDINGDGFDDIVIGAPQAYADEANEGYSFGASIIVFGKASSFANTLDIAALDGSNGLILKGADSGAEPYSYSINAVGSSDSVDGIGDFNGDGFDDLIISGHALSYVVFGTETWFGEAVTEPAMAPIIELADLHGSNGFTVSPGIQGISQGYSFWNASYSVHGAGDINGDGLSDLVIDVELGGYAESGKSYVLFGRVDAFDSPTVDISQLNGSDGFVAQYEVSSYAFDAVSSAGDINGDGFDDLVIGVSTVGNDYTEESASSNAYVLFGQDSADNSADNNSAANPNESGFAPIVTVTELDGNNGFVINDIEGADFSRPAISTAGEVNGDGIDDLLIGAAAASSNQENSGASYLVFGRQAAPNTDPSVDPSTDPKNVIVASGDGQPIIGGDGGDTVIGSEQEDAVYGRGGNDNIRGDDSDDELDGGKGRDSLIGDSGSDSLRGQRGTDELEGGDGNDVLKGNQGRDVLDGGGDNDLLLGGRGSDLLLGDDGDDLLNGGVGLDRLAGGAGQDTLIGGKGKDTFVFDLADLRSGIEAAVNEVSEDGASIEDLLTGDRIVDFEQGRDLIELTGGLTLGALSFEGNQIILANPLDSGITAPRQILVTLSGINTTTLSAQNFIQP